MQKSDCASGAKGLLVVVSGPSAVGKDTILEQLLSAPEKLPRPVRRCVTVTTRPARTGEKEGRDYYFLTVPQFHEMASRDGFLEYANVFGNWYGTPCGWVAEQRAAGVDVILKIDVQGGLAVQERVSDALLVFFRPPSLEELERRLRARGTETEEQIARRLLDARNEMAQMAHYDYSVVNDKVEDAVIYLRSILRAEHCRIRPAR
ncbi:MAG TPA: guanylate kinase [Capsulimonadaceae bacterium]|nr:guanylate kinase [Capsulimonadaceae bacterium]